MPILVEKLSYRVHAWWMYTCVSICISDCIYISKLWLGKLHSVCYLCWDSYSNFLFFSIFCCLLTGSFLYATILLNNGSEKISETKSSPSGVAARTYFLAWGVLQGTSTSPWEPQKCPPCLRNTAVILTRENRLQSVVVSHCVYFKRAFPYIFSFS